MMKALQVVALFLVIALVVGNGEIESVTVSEVVTVASCSDLSANPNGNELYFLDGATIKKLDLGTLVETSTSLTSVTAFTMGSPSTLGLADGQIKGYDLNSSSVLGTPFDYPAGGTLLNICGNADIQTFVATFSYSSPSKQTFTKISADGVFNTVDNLGPTTGLAMRADGIVYHCSNYVIKATNISDDVTVISENLIGLAGNGDGLDGNETVARIRSQCYTSLENSAKLNPEWLYVSSRDGHTIRLMNLNGVRTITTIAGKDQTNGDTSGDGSVSRLFQPRGISVVEISPYEHHAYFCDSANSKIKKIEVKFKKPATCDARIALVLDRTYSSNSLAQMKQATSFYSSFVDNLSFGGATMSLINLRQHTTELIVGMNDTQATNQTAMKAVLAEQVGGWKHRASQFWTLFTDIADSVSMVGKKSYIVLVTDGRLRDSWRWNQHYQRKLSMEMKWGADVPEIVCVLVGRSSPTKFLQSICDGRILIDGQNGTLAEQAADLAATVCLG